jgi:hypothetical protein
MGDAALVDALLHAYGPLFDRASKRFVCKLKGLPLRDDVLLMRQT